MFFLVLVLVFSFPLMANAFSFPLTEKKQKVKAARILLKSVSVELKKKNSLRSNSFFFLTLPTPWFLNVKSMRPVFLVTRLRHRSVGIWNNIAVALLRSVCHFVTVLFWLGCAIVHQLALLRSLVTSFFARLRHYIHIINIDFLISR